MPEILGFREVRTVKFIKSVISEFLATTIFIVTGCGASITVDAGKPPNILTASLIAATTVAFVIHTFGHVSGAFFNPAITLGFLVTGRITVAKTLAYICAQCSGSIAGSAVLWYMVPVAWRGSLCSTVFAEEVTLGQGFAVEVISTFFLLMGIFAASDINRTDLGGSPSLTVGLIVFTQIAWAGSLTGCSMNPARTLGPAVMSGIWDNHWVYWVAPVLGAIIGSLFYHHVLAQSPSSKLDRSIEIETAGDSPKKDSKKNTSVTESSDLNQKAPTFRYLKDGICNAAVDVDTS